MKEGEDYLLTEDPQSGNADDWAVILKHPDYDKVVGKYTDIQILDQGTKLSFRFHPLFVPEEAKDVTTVEFYDHVAEVLSEIIKAHHEKNAMKYYSKETGEYIEFNE